MYLDNYKHNTDNANGINYKYIQFNFIVCMKYNKGFILHYLSLKVKIELLIRTIDNYFVIQ